MFGCVVVRVTSTVRRYLIQTVVGVGFHPADAVWSLSTAATGPNSCTWTALDRSDVITVVHWGRGEGGGQLFALIVRCHSALLTTADASLINGKRCVYIL